MKRTAAAAFALLLATTSAHAQISDDVVKIGVLTDLSGLYAANTGPGSVEATKMAAEDFGGTILGKKIEVISADHQNKPDVASGIARKWIDEEHVDVITSVANSAVGLATQGITRDKNRILLNTAAATSDFTGKNCSPVGVGWTYDTYALASGTAKALVKQGFDTWYFLTADYAFGHALERDTGRFVTDAGGKVLGSSSIPLSNADFSAFLLQAAGSHAKVIGLANAGGDFINSVKQSSEFGITSGGQRLAALLTVVQDIHAIGLKTAQGLTFTDFGYWDLNDETRAFTKRFMARTGFAPNYIHLNDYSATTHYLKAVKAAGTDEAGAVMKKMRELKVNDMIIKNGWIREDGRLVHGAWLAQVKKPEESKGEWDLLKIVAEIPAEDVIRPLSESECPLVKKN